MCVATLYQLSQMDGVFEDNAGKKEVHPNAKVTRAYVKSFNEACETSGKKYIIDEDESKRIEALAKEQHEERMEADRIIKDGGKAMGDFIKEAAKPRSKKKKAND